MNENFCKESLSFDVGRFVIPKTLPAHADTHTQRHNHSKRAIITDHTPLQITGVFMDVVDKSRISISFHGRFGYYFRVDDFALLPEHHCSANDSPIVIGELS
ncbi:MAG: hypothetical protein WCQ60_02025 [bacterium]